MAGDDLSGVRLKLRRGLTLIAELEEAWRAFLARRPYVPIAMHQFPDGRSGPGCEVRELVPEELGCLVGDAAHNIRASLDVLTNVLAARNGDPSLKSSMPVVADGSKWNEQKKTLNRLSPADFATLEATQPFVTGDQTLFDLHRLDIVDKHRVPVVAAGVAAMQGFSAKGASGASVSAGELPIRTDAIGVVPAGLTFAPGFGMQSTSTPRLTTAMIFAFASDVPHGEVAPTLRAYHRAATAVVDRF